MTVDVRREAIAAIEDEIGRVIRRRAKDGLFVAELDPEGDGVLLARSATAERPDQLTPQIEQLLKAADRAGRRPKLIVACAGVSGTKLVEKRPDLVAVLEGLDEDGCSWVAVHALDRIGRSLTTTQGFLAELDRRGAALYLMSHKQFERSALEPNERLAAIYVPLALAASEGSNIARRTHRGRMKARRNSCFGGS